MTSINDFSQFTALRAKASHDSDGALREVAEQFEALFVQDMLKSMRDASFGDPIFGDAGGGGMFRDMFDQQIAGDIASGAGIGLADLLVRQMQPASAPSDNAKPESYALKGVFSSAAATTVAAPMTETPSEGWQDAREFIDALLPFARKTAERLGVSPLSVMSQAALETGWGKHVMPASEGSSLNLFGIKAAGNWRGESVSKPTLEFSNGIARREVEPFRVYGSLAETFDDYAQFLTGNDRYQAVANQADNVMGFGSALQDAGYATDPAYAKKISGIAGSETMQRILHELKQTDLLSLSRQIAGVFGTSDGN